MSLVLLFLICLCINDVHKKVLVLLMKNVCKILSNGSLPPAYILFKGCVFQFVVIFILLTWLLGMRMMGILILWDMWDFFPLLAISLNTSMHYVLRTLGYTKNKVSIHLYLQTLRSRDKHRGQAVLEKNTMKIWG